MFEGKVAIVTGASRGIGLATARAFVDNGAEGVVITGRRPENLDQAVAQLVASGVDPSRVLATVARADSEEAATATVAAAIERFGGAHILVNNAGTNVSAGNLMEVDISAVDKTWEVNQRGPLIWSRAVWNGWMRDHGGSIVNVASVGGLRPSPMIGAYNISKAAVIFMTHQLAFELAPTVRVNAVAPAVVKTRLSEMLWKSDEKAAAAVHPLNRLGEPDDVARAIVYLSGGDWLTGVILPVDGGVSGATGGLA